MNRKQRRRLQDAQKVGPAPPPGVIDPFLHKATIQADMEVSLFKLLTKVTFSMHKTHSCPANLGAEELVHDPKPYTPTGAPVSFSLTKEDVKVSSNNRYVVSSLLYKQLNSFSTTEEGPSCSGLVENTTGTKAFLMKPPEPPAISNNQQLDRKEKVDIKMVIICIFFRREFLWKNY